MDINSPYKLELIKLYVESMGTGDESRIKSKSKDREGSIKPKPEEKVPKSESAEVVNICKRLGLD
jgi:hypothetical protein